jgi:hypothetical protein
LAKRIHAGAVGGPSGLLSRSVSVNAFDEIYFAADVLRIGEVEPLTIFGSYRRDH